MTAGARERWERLFSGCLPVPADSWLEKYDRRLAVWGDPVLDLGCGSGGDTAWLLERGRRVVACDWAEAAVELIRRRYPEVEAAIAFDMAEGLPFPDRTFGTVLADLSLHYFSQERTFFLLGEIRRVLRPGGALLFRVNSVKDLCYGAGGGVVLEPHFYQTADGERKRFFDREDLENFFAHWRLEGLTESSTLRYGPEKFLWEGAALPKE